jgi:uncharacterized membrane protein YccC
MTATMLKLDFPSMQARLRSDWPEALRMVIAALLSFGLSHLFHMREAYWSVLTALVVARPQASGTAMASRDRIVGTIIGAGLASVLAIARIWHVPDLVLLIAALAPLSLLVVLQGNFRTAPIAAIIVLSAAPGAASPFGTALYRSLQIGMGALIASLVSLVVIPSHGRNKARDRAATALLRSSELFASALHAEAMAPERITELRDETRTLLRELGATARAARARTGSTELGRMVRALANLHADINFLDRITAAPADRSVFDSEQERIRNAAQAFHLISVQTAARLRQQAPDASPSTFSFEQFERALIDLEQVLCAMDSKGRNMRTVQMTVHVLQTIRGDYRDLLAVTRSRR